MIAARKTLITFRCGLHQPSSKKFPSRAKRGREAKRSSIRKCPMPIIKSCQKKSRRIRARRRRWWLYFKDEFGLVSRERKNQASILLKTRNGKRIVTVLYYKKMKKDWGQDKWIWYIVPDKYPMDIYIRIWRGWDAPPENKC